MSSFKCSLQHSSKSISLVGFVGKPFPGVQVCIAKKNAYSPTGYDILSSGNEYGTKVAKGSENESGDLLVKGPNVFKEYWNKPEATREAFTSDGWFKTGKFHACTVLAAPAICSLFSSSTFMIVGKQLKAFMQDSIA